MKKATTYNSQKHTTLQYLTTVLRLTIALSFILSGMMKGVNLQAVGQTIRDYSSLFGLTPSPEFLSVAAFGICVLEIWIGLLALDMNIYRRLWPAYLLILSGFAFLTFVNMTSTLGNFESCGCFGEIIHLNASETFIKNILLLGLNILTSILVNVNRNINVQKQLTEKYFLKRYAYICISLSSAPILFSMVSMNKLSSDLYLSLYATISTISLIIPLGLIAYITYSSHNPANLSITSKSTFSLVLSRLSLKIIVTGMLFVTSCGNLKMTPEEKYLEQALEMAGDNRTELEKVLSHYSDNPERLEAAKWLISNMPMHHSKTGKELEKYRRYFETAADQSMNPQTIKDSLDSIYGPPDLTKLDIAYDIMTMDSAYLVENIDAAFEAREKYPWGRNVRWEDFLEFVLPYRLGDEPLTNWRRAILEEYGELIDSIATLPEAVTPRIASDLLFKEWIWRKKFKWTSRLPNGPRIGPDIVEWKTGGCREKADGMCYLLRASGLPAAMHIAPMRGDLNDTHSWGVIYDSDGSPWLPEQHTDSAYKSIVPATKVYCETFSINREIPLQNLNPRLANPNIANPFVRDETEWYLKESRRKSFKLPLSSLYGVSDRDTVYIASSSRKNWIPVGMGIAKRDSVDFGYVGEKTVCVAGIMKDGNFSVRSYPFKTSRNADTSLTFFIPGELKPTNLYSKHTLTVGDFTRRMINGTFEVSDNPDFAKFDTIHLISESPKRLFTKVEIENAEKYRYVRYKGADRSHCNIASIAFFENSEDTIPLTGRILNAPGYHPSDDKHDLRNAWDGDPYTSFDLKEASGGWIGLDLGCPKKIEKIVFAPRNRGNYIHAGYTYELFFFDNKEGWKSLGTKKAVNDMITMKAPKGALLYLHCIDTGKDERIFEYDDANDLQVYW